MSDEEFDRELRAARPHTAADDGWVASPDGERALAAIRGAVAGPPVPAGRPRRVRPFTLVAGLAAAAAVVVVAASLAAGGSTGGSHPAARPPGSTAPPRPVAIGPAPAAMSLVAYDSCGAMLDGLRAQTAQAVTAYGLGGGSVRYGLGVAVDQAAVPGALSSEKSPVAPTTVDHSTTNVQEAGVGEPDTIETDGRRVVSVSGGVLRVVDASTHRLTGRLDLSVYAGASSAQLLMSGDRVLVILGDQVPYYRGVMYDRVYPDQAGVSTFLLVDLSAAPTIVGTLHPHGGYVDARMVDGTVRLVVQSTPKLAFPTPAGNVSDRQRLRQNRTVVAHAPLSAWLPTYDMSVGAATSTHTVGCGRVSHPATYTGTAMLTVYTVDLVAGLGDPQPVTLAADGTAVYATASSLYVASADGSRTQLHRFDITGSTRPTYLGSGTVPGALFDSYSMSEYAGALRVVTTTYPQDGQPVPVSPALPGSSSSPLPRSTSSASPSSAVYVLDADTLRVRGHVGGLGIGEQLHGVRFLGSLAYVVTFRSVDPLYVLDLHDPARPRRAGELTVTGYSDYLHPVAAGRLLGVGENVNGSGIVTGLQLSLFDVATPAHPTRLARLTQRHSPSETPIDPHAFLYWPALKLAVVPIDSWNPDESGAALVVRVGDHTLTTVGTIRNPAVSNTDGYDSGIQRTLVIGNDIWTMSTSGMRVSDLHSLAGRAWVPFG